MNNFQFDILPIIVAQLLEEAKGEDELFADVVREKESRTEKPKSITECCDYMYGEFYAWALNNKTGNHAYGGCDSEQLKDMIRHYYDEDDIEIKKVTGAKMTAGTTKEAKPKKPVRPKENLNCINVPMIRPETLKEAKRESKKQAKSVIVMDLFGGLSGDDEDLPED